MCDLQGFPPTELLLRSLSLHPLTSSIPRWAVPPGLLIPPTTGLLFPSSAFRQFFVHPLLAHLFQGFLLLSPQLQGRIKPRLTPGSAPTAAGCASAHHRFVWQMRQLPVCNVMMADGSGAEAPARCSTLPGPEGRAGALDLARLFPPKQASRKLSCLQRVRRAPGV